MSARGMQKAGLQGQVPACQSSRTHGPRPSQCVRPVRRQLIIANSGEPAIVPRLPDMQGDPFGLLLKQRILFLGGEVSDFSADAVISQLLLLDGQNPKKDMKLFINSPGGSVVAGMGLYDTMMMCRADIQTYCFGLAASMGAFLLGAGTRGKRYSMPNARIMIHQPLGGATGEAQNVEIQAREIMFHKANLNRIIADYTGQTLDKVEADTDRDRYMSPLEAKEYGIIDKIVGGEDKVFIAEGKVSDLPQSLPKGLTMPGSSATASAGPIRSERFTGSDNHDLDRLIRVIPRNAIMDHNLEEANSSWAKWEEHEKNTKMMETKMAKESYKSVIQQRKELPWTTLKDLEEQAKKLKLPQVQRVKKQYPPY